MVHAFTASDDGSAGPAERSGKVMLGDRVARVGGRSTAGLDYAGVLDLIVGAARPLTIHFERRGAGAGGEADGGTAVRVAHEEWRGRPGGQEGAE